MAGLDVKGLFQTECFCGSRKGCCASRGSPCSIAGRSEDISARVRRHRSLGSSSGLKLGQKKAVCSDSCNYTKSARVPQRPEARARPLPALPSLLSRAARGRLAPQRPVPPAQAARAGNMALSRGLRCCQRAFAWLPVLIIALVVLWSYYAYVCELCLGEPRWGRAGRGGSGPRRAPAFEGGPSLAKPGCQPSPGPGVCLCVCLSVCVWKPPAPCRLSPGSCRRRPVALRPPGEAGSEAGGCWALRFVPRVSGRVA